MRIEYKMLLSFIIAFVSIVFFIVISFYYLFTSMWFYPASFFVFLSSISYYIYLQRNSGIKTIEIGKKKKNDKPCKSCRQTIDNNIKR